MSARILIAAPHSGAGKTTVATGLMRALARLGLVVQAFKAGPDYIDPQCHHAATGRPGWNLDLWMMGEEAVCELFARATTSVDVAVIEGVMGLYDGAVGGAGSTADLARLLKVPVVLVLDASAGAQSLAATALGFRMYDREVALSGVIANRVGSQGHVASIAEALSRIDLPLLGAIPWDERLQLPEGRLGLVLDGALAAWVDRAGEAVQRGVDLDRLLAIARGAPALRTPSPPRVFAADAERRDSGLHIGLARDEAFWFYYADVLAWLRFRGVELVEFSPIRDAGLPPGIHGVWLGGGFPERHAAALAANEPMRRSLQAAHQRGLPIYAECGGFQYLLRELAVDGARYPMAGILPGRTCIEPRLQGIGYRMARSTGAAGWLDPGTAIRGHVFHYGRPVDVTGAPAWSLHYASGEFERTDGVAQPSCLASYLHVHLATQPRLAERFFERCRRFRDAGVTG